MKFPLIAFKGNIVINDKGEPFAIYKLKSKPYNHKVDTEKKIVTNQFEQMLWGLEGKGMLLLLNEILHVDQEEYLKNAGAVINELTHKEAYSHAESARRVISAVGRKLKRYLVHQLKTSVLEDDWKSILNEFRDSAVGLFFGTEKWAIDNKRVRSALEAEDELYKKIRYAVTGKADFNDIDFILRRNTKRVGVLPPPLPSRDGGKFTPAIISAFSDGCMFQEKSTYVEVTSGMDDIHYQSFITFPDLPKAMPEIGSEWIALLVNGVVPVDVAIHYEIIKAHKAEKQAKSRRKFLRGQIKETTKGNEDISSDEEYGYVEGRKLIGKLSAGQPLAKMSVALAIGDSDLKNARSNATNLINRYSPSGFRAVRPIGDQIKCLYSFIPGSNPAAPRIECDPGQIAAGGPTVSLEMGDSTGFLIGWSGGAPIYWKPGHAAKVLKRSNAWMITGALGGGKSLLIKLLCYLAYLAGAYLFVIDPKDNEYAAFEELFPIKRIDLCPGGMARVNPFMLSKDPMQAKTYVEDYLSFALNAQGDKDLRTTAISQAIDVVCNYDPDKRNLFAVLDVLKEMAANNSNAPIKEESMQCYLMLERIKNSDLGQMVFGTGGVEEVARATVVNMQGLPLPRTAEGMRQGITPNERQGLGLLYLASVMAREVAFNLPKEIVKVEVFDECWMLSKISPGIRILDEIVRMAARSYGAIPILGTQNITDMSNLQAIQNFISYVACFRATDKNEIGANLDMIGAAEDKESGDKGLYNRFPEFESGWCVMRDALGRISEVYIDPRPQKLLNIFETSPGEKKGGKKGGKRVG